MSWLKQKEKDKLCHNVHMTNYRHRAKDAKAVRFQSQQLNNNQQQQATTGNRFLQVAYIVQANCKITMRPQTECCDGQLLQTAQQVCCVPGISQHHHSQTCLAPHRKLESIRFLIVNVFHTAGGSPDVSGWPGEELKEVHYNNKIQLDIVARFESVKDRRRARF